MSKYPKMPFYVDAYLCDTRQLTLSERGAYTDILFYMWAHGGSLLDDDKEICRMLGIGKKAWLTIRARLLDGFLEIVGKDEKSRKIVQRRLQLEWNKCRNFSATQSERGKLSQKGQFETKQILRGLSGSRSVATGLGDSRSNGTGCNGKSTTSPIKDIITSLQDAEAPDPLAIGATAHFVPPEDKSDGGGPATALPTGAPSRPEPEPNPDSPETEELCPSAKRLLGTGLMQGKTPFLPRKKHG